MFNNFDMDESLFSKDVLFLIRTMRAFIDKAHAMEVEDLETARHCWQYFTEALNDVLRQKNTRPVIIETPAECAIPETENPMPSQTCEEKGQGDLLAKIPIEDDLVGLEHQEPQQVGDDIDDNLDKVETPEMPGRTEEEEETGSSNISSDVTIHVQVLPDSSRNDTHGPANITDGNQQEVCPVCGKCFGCKSNLVRHVKSMHKEQYVYVCEICDQNFKTLRLLDKHKHFIHDVNPSQTPATVPCDQCTKLFTSTSNLKVHVRHCHEQLRNFGCTECDKTFQTKSNLKRHVQATHRGLRPWQCATCQACFTEKKSLERHEAIHTGLKIYRCDICGKQLATKWSLTQHQAQHSNARPYLCDTCGQTFVTKSNLDGHRQIHLGIRNHPCTLCKRSFFSKGDLNRHMRSHTGVKPYSCPVCSKPFSRLEYLNEHLNAHAGVTPYICPTCDKGFSDRSGFHKHSKRCASKSLLSKQENPVSEGGEENLGRRTPIDELESANILPETSPVLDPQPEPSVTFIDIDVKQPATDFTDPLQMFYINEEDSTSIVTEHIIQVTSGDTDGQEVEVDTDGGITGQQILDQIQVGHVETHEERILKNESDVPQNSTQSYCVLHGDKSDFVIPPGTLVSEEAVMPNVSEINASNIQWYVQQVVTEDSWQDPDIG